MEKYNNGVKFTDAQLLTLSIHLNDANLSEVARFKELLNCQLDWHYLSKDLIDNRLAPFFYYNLKRTHTTHLVPSCFLKQISLVATQITVNNMLLFNAFEELVKIFYERQIDFIVLKGMALYFTVYKMAPFRYMWDIDLLVKESQLERVKIGLSDLGYRISASDHPTVWHAEILSSALKELPFDKKDEFGNTRLDIHWGLIKGMGSTTIDQNRLWENPLSLDINGLKVSILSPENLLIHLCLHLHKNMVLEKMRLIGFRDIIEAMRFYENVFDWNYFIELITKEEIENLVYPILAWLSALKLVKLPQVMEHKIKPFTKEEFLNGRVLHLIKVKQEGEYYLGLLSHIHGLQNKIRFIASLVLPTPLQLKNYYSLDKNNCIFFFYPYHWQRTIVKIYRSFKNLLIRLYRKEVFLP